MRQTLPQATEAYRKLGLTPTFLRQHTKESLLKWCNRRKPAGTELRPRAAQRSHNANALPNPLKLLLNLPFNSTVQLDDFERATVQNQSWLNGVKRIFSFVYNRLGALR